MDSESKKQKARELWAFLLVVGMVFALLVVALLLIVGCASPRKEQEQEQEQRARARAGIERIPGLESATLAPVVADAVVAIVPWAGLRLDIELTDGEVILSWNSNGVWTVSSGPNPSGPWSAITNASSPVAIARLGTNGFYRLSQSSLKVTRHSLEPYGLGPFCGDNQIAFMGADLPWTISATDDLLILTNGVLYPIPLTAPGLQYCPPIGMVVDVPSRQLFTVNANCLYGPRTGPYTFRSWVLSGSEGYFENAQPVTGQNFGAFGDNWGDMIRLQSGAIALCWKAAFGYCFKYRDAQGQWQPDFCLTNIQMASSKMTLGQHPDGTVMGFIIRDGQAGVMAQPVFKEQGGNLVWQATLWQLEMEGEIPVVTAVPDYANNQLLVSRNCEPWYGFAWGEAWGTVKGSVMRTAFMDSADDFVDSPRLPDSVAVPGSEANYNEPVNSHAAVIASGKLWLIRQEFAPQSFNFSLVYATAWEGDRWGDKHFLYQTPRCDNCRGLARNWLTSYRNSDPNPTRLMFANLDENGKTVIFELGTL